MDENVNTVGCWAIFNEAIDESISQKPLLEYLSVITQPPKFPDYKKVLDDMLMKLYARFCWYILWKNKDTYKNVIALFSVFHQFRVKPKLLFERHAYKGYCKWSIDLKTIASESADQAMERKHYYRCMPVHKEGFGALILFRFKKH